MCVRPLGQGGFGTVYLAVAPGPAGVRRTVALKLIGEGLLQDATIERMFIDEARICSLLDHPHICRILDFGTDREQYYMALELGVGETLVSVRQALSERCDQERWSPFVARVLADTAWALDHAHHARDAQGAHLQIVHRDLAPANVMVRYSGHAFVLDFGVAKARDKLHATTRGAARGRVTHSAPEQLQAAPIDARADVWSLGVLLHELLTGRPLFARRTSFDAILAVTREPIAAPSAVRPSIEPELDELASWALSRSLEDRCPSAGEFAAALEEYLRSCPLRMTHADAAQLMAELFPGSEERMRRDFERDLNTLDVMSPTLEPNAAAGTPMPSWRVVVAVLGLVGLFAVAWSLVALAVR